MARAVRGEAAPSRPAPPVLLGSPDQESSSEDAITRAVRGDAAPSRPEAPASPDFGHLEVDRHSPPIVQSSEEEHEVPGRGENSFSKDEPGDESAKPLPSSLQRLLQGYPQMGDDYAPYTAVLGSQRRNPKLIWHHFVAVRQELPRIPETHVALQRRGQQYERKVFQLTGYGTNRAAFAREDGTEVLKIGMSGCHGLEALLTPRVLPLAARIYDAGQIHMKVSGRKVAMDLIVQQKLVLLRDFIKINGALPEEYWSYTIAVVSAVAARGLNLADLGQSNLACEATSGPWPKVRFLDLGSWHENKEGEPPAWPSRDSELWSFMSGHIEAAKVATLKSIAHGFKSIEEVHSSVRSVLRPAFPQALKEDGAWL